MTEADIRKIVAESVNQTLTQLGIDAGDPLEFQRDMQHLRAWRESVSTVKRQSLLVAVGIVMTGIIGLIWTAVKGS